MLIPYTVSRFFTPTAAVYQIYFSVATSAGCDAGYGRDQARAAVAASCRVGVQRAEPDPASHRGGTNCRCADLGPYAGRVRHAAGERHRHHEHHAGDGDLAHSRDWDSQSHRRHQPRNPLPVSRGSDSDLADRRRRRDRGRPGDPLFACASSPTTACRSQACRRSSPSWCRRLWGSSSAPSRPPAPRSSIRSKVCATSRAGSPPHPE